MFCNSQTSYKYSGQAALTTAILFLGCQNICLIGYKWLKIPRIKLWPKHSKFYCSCLFLNHFLGSQLNKKHDLKIDPCVHKVPTLQPDITTSGYVVYFRLAIYYAKCIITINGAKEVLVSKWLILLQILDRWDVDLACKLIRKTSE